MDFRFDEGHQHNNCQEPELPMQTGKDKRHARIDKRTANQDALYLESDTRGPAYLPCKVTIKFSIVYLPLKIIIKFPIVYKVGRLSNHTYTSGEHQWEGNMSTITHLVSLTL